jgi:hypothetical protein
MTGAIAMGTNKITGLGTPTVDTDACTKLYVDSVALGFSIRAPVRVKTTGSITLTGAGSLISDGVTLILNDRILVANQATQSQNGIYTVTTANPYVLTRASDADNSPVGEVKTGIYVFVSEGSGFAGTSFVLTTFLGTINTDSQVYTQVSQSSNTYMKEYVDNKVGILLPDQSMIGYVQSQLNNYINSIKQPNTLGILRSYTHGVTTGSYNGGVYSPLQNRIYMAPAGASTSATWHYINCDNGSIVPYSGVALPVNAYIGCVYSPKQDRVYFIPNLLNSTTWHYIDCTTGSLQTYTGINNGYKSGVYSPLENKIYLIPSGNSGSIYSYIDCTNTTVVTFTGHSTTNGGYSGGVYEPTLNRIYFIPGSQGTQAIWSYIDCNDGTAKILPSTPLLDLTNTYSGGVYSPLENKIYMIPYYYSNRTTWHYIDCTNGNVIGYTAPLIGSLAAYAGGVYSPIQNRIYMIPYNISTGTTWHYIDCNTGSIVGYTVPSLGVSGSYYGGVYSPLQNRIYMVPSNASTLTAWHYIDIISKTYPNHILMSNSMFNKF